jgi:site-specific recombinase XerD
MDSYGRSRKKSPRPAEPGVALVRAPELGSQLSPLLEPLIKSAKDYATQARGPATHRAYEYQQRRFRGWWDEQGSKLPAFPASSGAVAIYIAACADEPLKVASISQAMSAIAAWHKENGLASPCAHPQVQEVWSGIKRKLGTVQEHKTALKIDALREMIETAPDNVLGARDRALLVTGFAGGFRRSELVAVNVEDLTFVKEGVEILIRKSKTDQYGKGLTKVIAFGSDEACCPVRLLKQWLATSGIETGPVFRRVDRHGNVGKEALTGRAVAVIVKCAATRAGFKETGALSGHSLRAGFVTEAKRHGADDKSVMDQTGHRSVQMLLRYYQRDNKWEKPASAKLGL